MTKLFRILTCGVLAFGLLAGCAHSGGMSGCKCGTAESSCKGGKCGTSECDCKDCKMHEEKKQDKK